MNIKIPYIDIVKALLVAVLWCGSFVAAKLVLEYCPPIFSMVIRSIIVILVLLLFVGLPNISFKKYYLCPLVITYGIALFGYRIRSSSIYCSYSHSNAGASITSLLTIIILKEKMHLKQVIGMLISFIGIVIIVGHLV